MDRMTSIIVTRLKRLVREGRLTQREVEIIRRRCLETPPETLAAIAHSYGVSRERVRQIEQKALSKLLI